MKENMAVATACITHTATTKRAVRNDGISDVTWDK